jgi:hypothetical protein
VGDHVISSLESLKLAMSTRVTPQQLRTPAGLFSVTLIVLISLTSGCGQAARRFDPSRDSLSSNQPQTIYSSETADPWNRLFQLLFTRTLDVRRTAGEPTLFHAGDDRLILATGTVRRIESGDRAIDPLYPSWIWMDSAHFDMSASGSWEILREPRYSQLVEALKDVQRSASQRPPLARALMQADLWATFDIFFAMQSVVSRGTSADAGERQRRTGEILPLLATTIRALALDARGISNLPNTYAEGIRRAGLPDLSGARSEWVEVRPGRERMHDHAANYRRAARVFVKPRGVAKPTLASRLQEGAAPETEQLGAVALVIQTLLISDAGVPVPSPITYEVQLRTFQSDGENDLLQYELSRKRLLSSPASGGMVQLRGDAPAYLPIAGNDLSFATRPRRGESPVLVSLRHRCQSCHGRDLGTVISVHSVMPHPERRPPPVEHVTPSEDEHVRFVARRKAAREDFRALSGYWRQ